MKYLRITTLLALSLFLIFSATAQKDKSKRPSPPAQITKKIGDANVTIDYSQPSKRGRDIYGGLVPNGKIWRTGANESTWIELSQDVSIQGKSLAAGKYAIFTIPDEEEWTIIFNGKWDGWGAYEYKASDDVLRVKAKPSAITEEVEKFTIELTNEGVVSILWDKTKVDFTIEDQ